MIKQTIDHPRKVPGKMATPYAEAVKLAEKAAYDEEWSALFEEFSIVSCISRQQQCELQYNRQCWQQALAIALKPAREFDGDLRPTRSRSCEFVGSGECALL